MGWKGADIEYQSLTEQDLEHINKKQIGERKRAWARLVESVLISRNRFNKALRRELSQPKPYGYGAYSPDMLKFADYIVLIEDTAWVIEGKDELDFEAIGQVMVYSTLFSEDNPIFKVKKAIVCEKTGILLEIFCEKNGIEIL